MAFRTDRTRSYTALALLAAAVLYFALDLSRGDRHLLDYVVISLVVAAFGWNILQLCRRLYAADGGRGAWHVLRTVGFWIIGAMNTVYAPEESAGRWTVIGGWVMIGVAALDTFALHRRERSALRDASRAREHTAEAR